MTKQMTALEIEIAALDEEDAAQAARRMIFSDLGRQMAAEAIDQAHAYEDAQGAYEDNLFDTITENHPDATPHEVDAAHNAYLAAWAWHNDAK